MADNQEVNEEILSSNEAEITETQTTNEDIVEMDKAIQKISKMRLE